MGWGVSIPRSYCCELNTPCAAVSNVHSAEANLQNDQASARTTIQDDQAAIHSATNGSQRQAAVEKYFSDLVSTGKTIAADQKAVQAAIDADSGVQSAEAQLESDEAPIRADVTTLVADEAQLARDTKAAISG
jgi:hypothetical protein